MTSQLFRLCAISAAALSLVLQEGGVLVSGQDAPAPNAPFLGLVDTGEGLACPVCGIGGTVGNPDGFIQFRTVQAPCGAFDLNVVLNPGEQTCTDLQDSSLIAALCGCTGNPADNSCPVCGDDEITIPDGVITNSFLSGTCGLLNSNQRTILPSECAGLQASLGVRQICGCQAPTPPPTLRPTVAPTPAPTALSPLEELLEPINRLIADVIRTIDDFVDTILGVVPSPLS